MNANAVATGGFESFPDWDSMGMIVFVSIMCSTFLTFSVTISAISLLGSIGFDL